MKVRQIARQATDTFIVYYAGHGLKAPSAKGLFLAVTQTTEDDCFLNGVEFEGFANSLRSALRQSGSCFWIAASAGKLRRMKWEPCRPCTESIDIRNISMASSPAHRLSVAPVGARFTAFSGHLISILESGIEAASDILTLDDIYDELRRRIRKDPSLPEPQRRVEMDGTASGWQGISRGGTFRQNRYAASRRQTKRACRRPWNEQALRNGRSSAWPRRPSPPRRWQALLSSPPRARILTWR